MNKTKNLILKITPKFILDIYSSKIIQQQIHVHKRIANVSYSKHGEDISILEYFGGRRWGGCFIDVGAYHPYLYSNTYSFYKMGWRGINIEPNPDNFKLISKKRKRDMNLNMGIAKEEGMLKYYMFNYPALNTFVESVALEHSRRSDYNIVSTLEVKTNTLVNVLDQYLPAGQDIDFMNIDVEGMDYEVLMSNDWNKYRPKLICIEEREIYEAEKFNDVKIYAFLKKIGYKLYCVNGISLLFEDSTIKTGKEF